MKYLTITNHKTKEFMELTKLQVRQIVTTHLQKENGLNDVMELMLEAMMKAERNLFLEGRNDNKANCKLPLF